MAKFKVVRSEFGSSDEVILEGDNLEEIARLARAKSGQSGMDLGIDAMDLGFDDDEDGGLL